MALLGLSKTTAFRKLQQIVSGNFLELRRVNQGLNQIIAKHAPLNIKEVDECIKKYLKSHNGTLVEQELTLGNLPSEEETHSSYTVLKINGKNPTGKEGETHLFVYFYDKDGKLKRKIYLHVTSDKTTWFQNIEIQRVGNTVIRFEIAFDNRKLFHSAINVKDMDSERHYYRPENSAGWYRMLKDRSKGSEELVSKEDLGDLDSQDIAPLKMCVALFQK